MSDTARCGRPLAAPYDKALNTFIIPNSTLGEKSQITEMNGFLLYNMQLKKSRKTLDVVQY